MMSLVTGYKYTTNQQMKAIIYKRNTGNQNKMDDTKTYTGPIHYKSTNESDYIKKNKRNRNEISDNTQKWSFLLT